MRQFKRIIPGTIDTDFPCIYNPEFDEFQRRNKEDSRKPKMTLETLSKLRKAREIKRAEEIEHGKFQKVMYATPGADAGAGGII